MKLSILLQTADYRGDHAKDILVPIEPKPNETVEELVKRSRLGDNHNGEVLEIRLMETATVEGKDT